MAQTKKKGAVICCPDCKSAEVHPIDTILGAVEIDGPVREGERPGEIDYDPSGYTEITWDTATTTHLSCEACGNLWRLGDDAQAALAELREAAGYDPEATEGEASSVDALIDYKDALEDRLAEVIA